MGSSVLYSYSLKGGKLASLLLQYLSSVARADRRLTGADPGSSPGGIFYGFLTQWEWLFYNIKALADVIARTESIN